MKKIVVIGCNEFSKEIIQKVDKVFYDVIAILDDITSEQSFNGIVIDKIKNINNYNDSEIFVLDDMPYFDEIYHKLHDNKINKINVIIKENDDIICDRGFNDKIVQTYYLDEKPLLRYIEIHVQDKCNLRCNGCTHFSNITEENTVNVRNFKKNIKELKNKFDVSLIRLMGGEPLLNKDLHKYIEIARKAFPKATIFIVTNGLLIPKLSKKNINIINKNNIILNITLYKPTLKILEKIEIFLKQNKIKHRYGRGNVKPKEEDYIERFHTCLSNTKKTNTKKLNCYNQYCWFLRNKKIYKCCYPALINILNQKYDTNYIDKNNGITLKEIKDGWTTIKQLSKNIDFCDYCRNKARDYPWSNSKPNLNDYLLEVEENGNIKNK